MRTVIKVLVALLLLIQPTKASADPVRVGDLGRFLGWREKSLVGYGIVTGLSGSGDSPNSEITRQGLRNVLGRLGANVTPEQLRSRNVAMVMVTATLPATANVGDRIDVSVTSVGDARSLAGGTLLMTQLQGPDQHLYALAQGALVAGGHRFDANQNARQRNYPTAAVVPAGATVETNVGVDLQGPGGELTFVLRHADFTTAERIAEGINQSVGGGIARVRGADAVVIAAGAAGEDVNRLISRIQNVMVAPSALARVVINERTGTVVAGGGVQISSVAISQGDINVSITTENVASQPEGYGGIGDGVRSLVVSNTRLDVAESRDAVARFPNTTVGDLVQGLTQLRVDTRGIISVLQAIRAAGALHADIVVQ